MSLRDDPNRALGYARVRKATCLPAPHAKKDADPS